MITFVTGGSGFLGVEVVRQLTERGHRVVALARSEQAADRLRALGAVVVAGDLDDAASLRVAAAGNGADALVSLASLGTGHAPALVDAAVAAVIGRGVFVSTTSIFTDVAPGLKVALLDAEETITTSPLAWTILRPTMIYGTPDDRNMWRLLRLLRRTRVVPAPGANNLHQPVHVADLASAVVAVVERPATAGRSYAVAGPEAITLRTVLDQAGDAVGRRPLVVPMPAGPLIAGLRLVERVKRLPISAAQVNRLRGDKQHDIGAARADLDFDPRTFAAGIAAEAAFTD